MKNNVTRSVLLYSACLVNCAFPVFAQNTQNVNNSQQQRPRQERQPQTLAENPNANLYPAHDPEIIKQGDIYYLFTTGGGVSSSKDLVNWKFEYNVFPKAPEWITQDMIPGFRGGGYWAPDISNVRGTYYLYYAYSQNTKITSVIGVATNKSLNPSDTNFKWVDHGLVIQSVPHRDFWNAIDPNLVMVRGQGWLVFGSFWDGIKMAKLSPDLLSIAKPEVWYSLASRPRSFVLDNTDPGESAIEGAFIYQRPGNVNYFYLFVSFDHCCRGLESTYKVVVGRSRNIEGPYVDKEGKLMMHGGGTIVAEGNEYWAGVGHSAHYNMDGKSIMVMHGYDKLDNGRSKLIIREMKWGVDDWPAVKL
jgi:arabinan endo-1,5-alpha-L-arabinosidase